MTTDSDRITGSALGASLTVSDLPRSLAWYRDVFGFVVRREFAREGTLFAVSLAAGDVAILLTRDDGARGERVKGEGFSLQITTSQDIDALAQGIRARGGVLDAEPETNRWGARAFRLRDPDGFRFVVTSGNA